MNPQEIETILEKHQLWLKVKPGGACADLTGAYLAGADLTGADLTGAYLAGADLTGADLTGADLAGADLAGADLTGADLDGANLDGANLAGANLAGANLAGANLPSPGFERLPSKVLAGLIIAEAEKGHLAMESWHTCRTTHCAWGFATTLNGDCGKMLENLWGIEAAGAVLFPEFSRFVHYSNDDAMVELKKIASEG